MRKGDTLWDRYHGDPCRQPKEDGWLATELAALTAEPAVAQGRNALDLGCGAGRETALLIEAGYTVTACDLSREAVALTRKRVPAASVSQIDLRDGLPWGDSLFDLVVASLSLHYFCWTTTTSIAREIQRVLHSDGLLVGRVNSTLDVHHGAGSGTEVEPGLLRYRGRYKRFFTEDDVRRLLNGWRVLSLRPEQTLRFLKPKYVIAFRASPPSE